MIPESILLARRANALLKELEVLELETPEGEDANLPKQEAVLRAFIEANLICSGKPSSPPEQDLESEDN